MLDAIQNGILTESTKERLESLELQKADLSLKNTKEELERPLLTKEQIIEWLKDLRKYGTKRLDHKRRLINIFVNSVYLYDDRIVINFNYKDGAKTVRVDEVNNLLLSSDSNVYALPKRNDHQKVVVFFFYQQIKLIRFYSCLVVLRLFYFGVILPFVVFGDGADIISLYTAKGEMHQKHPTVYCIMMSMMIE